MGRQPVGMEELVEHWTASCLQVLPPLPPLSGQTRSGGPRNTRAASRFRR
jgi:hypothetical protein